MPAIGVTIATIVAGELVQEARLADVGAAHEHDRQAFAQQRALLRAREHPGNPRGDRLDAAAHIGRAQELDVLLGKVERGFDEHSKLDQRLDQRANLRRKHAGQAARRGARRGRRRGVDQVRDAFGLREVELAVEERALRELAGSREARAQLRAAREKKPQHRGTAVPVQLEHVLAGIGSRRREVDREPLVDRLAGAAAKRRARGHAGCGRRAQNARDDRCERPGRKRGSRRRRRVPRASISPRSFRRGFHVCLRGCCHSGFISALAVMARTLPIAAGRAVSSRRCLPRTRPRTDSADAPYLRFAAASAASFSSTRFMCHCWKICSELLTSQ